MLADADVSLQLWLREIRGGDSIQIVPKAQYPGWVNYVNEAEIELQYVASPPDTFLPNAVGRPILSSIPEIETSIYRKLDKDKKDIRLIILDPGLSEDPISCSLIYTSLLNPSVISYEALSYCWGDSQDNQNIDVTTFDQDGVRKQHLLPITSSLYRAMLNLRLVEGKIVLWIDAICINQTDFTERSQQVAIMKDVYSQANRVVVWLGDGNEVTQKCIRAIKTISDRYEGSSKNITTEQATKELHNPLMMDDHFHHWFLDNFPIFDLPWFRRTWVIQEAFNAKAVVVRCGLDVLNWQTLLRVNRCMRRLRLWKNSVHKGVLPPLFGDLLDLSQKEGTLGQFERSPNMGILEILIKALDLDATDPRDKIFAMLQFGEETRQSEILPPEIIPNYYKSVAQVFSDFTRWWIVEHRSLRILSAIQAETGRTWQSTQITGTEYAIEGRPTWSIWYIGHSNYAESILGLSADCPYRAAGDTSPDINLIRQTSGSPYLPLTGRKLGVIECIRPFEYYATHPEHPERYPEIHRTYIKIFDPLNETGKWIQSIYSQQSDHNGVDPHDRTSHWGQHLIAHEEYSRPTGAVECHSKCLLKMADGTTGLCPSLAREGDLVIILNGGQVPYILRERKYTAGEGERRNRYEFIGECYLSGYMDGRAIREQKEQDLQTEIFELI